MVQPPGFPFHLLSPLLSLICMNFQWETTVVAYETCVFEDELARV